jgi:predicted AAA+ superfamily ATPase
LKLSNKTIDKYIYVLEKSFCIGLISPFWSNVKAELSKMQKVYFLDLGLRNAILNNFENIFDRLDK